MQGYLQRDALVKLAKCMGAPDDATANALVPFSTLARLCMRIGQQRQCILRMHMHAFPTTHRCIAIVSLSLGVRLILR